MTARQGLVCPLGIAVAESRGRLGPGDALIGESVKFHGVGVVHPVTEQALLGHSPLVRRDLLRPWRFDARPRTWPGFVLTPCSPPGGP